LINLFFCANYPASTRSTVCSLYILYWSLQGHLPLPGLLSSTRNLNFHPGIETTAVGVAQVDRPKLPSSRRYHDKLRSTLLQPPASYAPPVCSTTRRNARIFRSGIETTADGAAQVDRPTESSFATQEFPSTVLKLQPTAVAKFAAPTTSKKLPSPVLPLLLLQ